MNPLHTSVWKIILTATRNKMPPWCFGLGCEHLLKMMQVKEEGIPSEELARRFTIKTTVWAEYFREHTTTFPYNMLRHPLLSNRSTQNDVFDVMFYSAACETTDLKHAYIFLYVLPAFVRHLPTFAGQLHEGMRSYGVMLGELTADAIRENWSREMTKNRPKPWVRILMHAENMVLALNRDKHIVYAGVLNHIHQFLYTARWNKKRSCTHGDFATELRNIPPQDLTRYADKCCEGTQTVTVSASADDEEDASVCMDLSTQIGDCSRSVEGVLAIFFVAAV